MVLPMVLADFATFASCLQIYFCNFFVAFSVIVLALASQSTPPAKTASFEEVRAFLQQLHVKLSFLDGRITFPIFFRDGSSPEDSRYKNTEALSRLVDLGVSAQAGRRAIIESLVPIDFCEGPITNNQPNPHPGDLWVFGKYIKGEPYYIKLQMGHLNKSCICVSFHPPSSPLYFPFQ